MNKKSIFVSVLISLFIVAIYAVSEFYTVAVRDAYRAYQVYLNGEELGLISNRNELYTLINNEQQEIKDMYNVDYVYPPDGLDIIEVNTFNDNFLKTNEIYEKIENLDNFTIKGYIITIKSVDDEGKTVTKVINVLDKNIFNDAIKKFILSFITEEEYNKYINGNRSIDDIGEVIEDMKFIDNITIKEGFISVKDKIYTDVDSLAQYLLFGPDASMESYKVKVGDTIASISEQYQINSQEFLVANPEYKDENALLVVDSTVNVTLIDPIMTLSYTKYEISENTTPYTVNTVTDKNRPAGFSEITKDGVNGITLIHASYNVSNGQRSTEVDIHHKTVIREMVPQELTVGQRWGNGNQVINKGNFTYPTYYPYVITSPFGWRSHKMHEGIDISGTGFRSPIFSVSDGVVVEVAYRNTDGNFVIIEHENNIYSQYAHLYQSLVKVGDHVSKGEQIGEMGESGLAYGVHLHFGISIGWPWHGQHDFKNPALYINFR